MIDVMAQTIVAIGLNCCFITVERRAHSSIADCVDFHLKTRRIERDLIPYCQENRITVIAYTPLADGSLAGKSRLLPDKRGAALEEVARESGKTPAQVALNWCIRRPNVIAIPKSNSVGRTEENCAASGWRLSDQQLSILDQAFPA